MATILNAQLQPAYAYGYKAQFRKAYVKPLPAHAGDTVVHHAVDGVQVCHAPTNVLVYHSVDGVQVYHAPTNVLVYHSVDMVAVHSATPTTTV